ncbi:MAG: hypothetical protein SFU98_20260 [Leptospiraceae bacterium]|nr:hypothetical protein [Leptospiraceae bacterium]
MKKKSILLFSLLTIYILFWFWYGGSSNPISIEEGKNMMEKISKVQSVEEYSMIRSNFENAIPKDDGKEFFMINLEKEKQGIEAKNADKEYAKLVLPMLIRRGSFPIYVGTYFNNMIGSYGSEVTRVAIVRYRSLRDFLDMNSDPDMVKGAPFKFASLDHTEVFATKPIISVITVRFSFASLLILIGIFLYSRMK